VGLVGGRLGVSIAGAVRDVPETLLTRVGRFIYGGRGPLPFSTLKGTGGVANIKFNFLRSLRRSGCRSSLKGFIALIRLVINLIRK
jgi:hypothetical protein